MLSTQGSRGFDKEDATLYTASPELLEALEAMCVMATHHMMPEGERREILRNARTAIAKALGN